jgi:hypothetical protein
MAELATIFQTFSYDFLSKYGEHLLPSQRKAIFDISNCRTEIMGGTTYLCQKCGNIEYSYHSCQNRACPKCMNDRATVWLNKQIENILPVPYFMVTFTLPSELRQVTYLHQKELYNLLFMASSKAIIKLSKDRKIIGGSLGMMAVLHTWTRDLEYHVHVHYLIPAIVIDEIKTTRLLKKNYLFNSKPLSLIYRAKFKEGLIKAGYNYPEAAFNKQWVVHIQNVGSGIEALKYLAPYIFRVAISNKRIVSIKDKKVTFNFKEASSGQTKFKTLSGVEFMKKFLIHLLPKGLVKVRYYGFMQPGKKKDFNRVKYFLSALFILLLSSNLKTPKKTEITQMPFTCKTCGTLLVAVGRWEKYESRSPPLFLMKS